MSDINYNEKVVIPFLEKKCKDLLSVNLILEGKFLVEQNKNKDLVEHFDELTNKDFNQVNKISDLEKQIADLITQKSQTEAANNEAHQKEINELNRQKSVIESERNELNNRVMKLESDLKRETSVKDSISVEYSKLKMEFDNIQSEMNTLKQSINIKKVKESKLV